VGDNQPVNKTACEHLPTHEKSSISFEPKSASELAAFLQANKSKFHEIWVVLTKKKYANPQPISFTQAVTEAVAQDLIDSQTKTVDERKYAIRFTKRRAAKPSTPKG
jgi:hypothetical protein